MIPRSTAAGVQSALPRRLVLRRLISTPHGRERPRRAILADVLTLRPASLPDLAAVLPRTRALNAHEGIALEPAALEAALARLLGDPGLGGVWLVERDGAAIGYAIVTFGYDLEFGGLDAVLTELWIDPAERGRGAASAALQLIDPELRARGVRALHLQVRPDNPARALYQRSGFVASPRIVMTRRL